MLPIAGHKSHGARVMCPPLLSVFGASCSVRRCRYVPNTQQCGVNRWEATPWR